MLRRFKERKLSTRAVIRKAHLQGPNCQRSDKDRKQSRDNEDLTFGGQDGKEEEYQEAEERWATRMQALVKWDQL